MKALWTRLVALGFRLLYHELAWLYDPVSWAVSLGRWREWQATIWPYLPASGRVLEVGFGPGHVLSALSAGGYEAVGLDVSPEMARLARRRLRRRGLAVPLCLGRAQALPFAPGSFDAVVATFPTGYVYDKGWAGQLSRVLKDEGRAVLVETCRFGGRDLPHRSLEWLYRITGQSGPTPDLPAVLDKAGLSAEREWVEVKDTSVRLSVARKRRATGMEGEA